MKELLSFLNLLTATNKLDFLKKRNKIKVFNNKLPLTNPSKITNKKKRSKTTIKINKQQKTNKK